MNRCSHPLDTLILIALLVFPILGATLLPATAQAQVEVPGQTQNEAAIGGRNFPVGTLRGKFMVVNWPEIQVDGQAERMSPGGRIRDERHMLVMPAAITGQKLLVNYTRDAAGLVREVWVLSEQEAQAKRASADRPLLNFWPFVADRGPRDDGQTPFHMLPKYGE